MTQRQLFVHEIENAPESIVREVFDFYQFLKSKSKRKISNTLLASEAALKKDWLKEEEDDAWQDL